MSATSNDQSSASSALESIGLDESGDLIRLEGIVEKGLGTFMEVGAALAEIHDRKLYRTAHATFADYCKEKWKMSDRRARQLMDAAETTATISKSGTMVPKSERQARPLTALPKERRTEAWQAAAAQSPDGLPTAKAVQVVVETMNPESPKTVKVVVRKPTDDDQGTTKTPLQWLTHYWMLATEEQRKKFDNFRAGMRGGR